jgi:Ca-activated chloride channel family protein
MEFLHPEFLYFMLPPLFILFGLLLTQKEPEALFFTPEVMQRLRVSANTLTLKARNALFMIIGLLIILALADPVIKDGKVAIKAKSADIMIALDISDSMLAEDIYPNRLKFAKQKALKFLNLTKNERIGVVAFAKNSYLVSPLSFDHEAVAFLLSKLDTDSITEQGTDFLAMLEVVAKSIKEQKKKYLLLLSDGGDQKDFSREIAYAKKHNIKIFVLGIGTSKGAPIPLKKGDYLTYKGEIVVTKLNSNIASLATETGGVYIEGVNANRDIKVMVDEIEKGAIKKEMKSKEIVRYIPLFYYPVGLALLLLLIATSSMSKREHVEVPSLFLFGFLLFIEPSAKAGILDFQELREAKTDYEQGAYKDAAKYYESYAIERESSEAYYNAGNAFYKAKEYKKAIKAYKKAIFSHTNKRAKVFSNMGNAYAMLATQEALQKALKAYEESLKLQYDREVQENLDIVKKELKKRKKEQKNRKNQQNKNRDKQNKNNQNQQNKKTDKQNQNKQSTQSSKEGQKSQEKKSEKEKKERQKKGAESNSHKSKDMQNKSGDNKSLKHEQKSVPHEKKETIKALSQKQKQNNKAKNKVDGMESKKIKMSDAEAKKWLQSLSNDQETFLYRLNKEKVQKDMTDEKPW